METIKFVIFYTTESEKERALLVQSDYPDFNISVLQWHPTDEPELIVENMNRRTGRTTRLADFYIMQLFRDRKISVYDHPSPHKNQILQNNMDRRLMVIIMERLRNEHAGVETKFNMGLKTIELV